MNDYWNRERWLKEFPNKKDRQRLAKESAMAWILEYQPTILLPGLGYQPLEPYPFQQDFINDRSRYRVINKPRQCGISTIVAAEVAWEFDNVPGAQIMIVSKDLSAAQNFHTYVMDILRSVRLNNPKAPKLTKENQSETKNVNGSRIVSLAASPEAGRSFSPTHFVFDEAAFTVYDDSIWQAASSGLAKTRGRATVISTPKGRANWFYRIFEDAGDPSRGLPPHMGFKTFNYGWWDVPDYNPFYDEYIAAPTAAEKKKVIEKARTGEWYLGTRPSKTPLQWAQEFEGAFDANVGSAFSTRQIEKAFVRNYLTEKQDPEAIFTIWYSSERQENHLYASGIDLGRKNDPTVIITYDYTNTPAQVVDFKYIEPGAAGWDDIERVLLEHLQFWQPVANHDGTGIGDAVTEALEGYSEPVAFTKDGKKNMIIRVQHGFDSGRLRLPKIDPLFREHQRYIWDDKDIVQDTVMANALAVSAFYSPEDSSFYVSKFDFVGAAA